MRRLLACLMVAVGMTGIVPAGAHSCAGPVEIPVGEETTVTVGVAAEQSPVVGIDISMPAGFRFERAEDEFDWRATRTDSLLRYRGGTLPPYACIFFNLVGTAERQATLVFPITVHGEDGSVIEFTGERADGLHPAQLVYAGFSPAPRDEISGEGLPGAVAGGLVAAIIGISALALWRGRQTRRRPPRPVPRTHHKKSRSKRR